MADEATEPKEEGEETSVETTEVEIPEETLTEIKDEVVEAVKAAQAEFEKKLDAKFAPQTKEKAILKDTGTQSDNINSEDSTATFGTTRATQEFETARKEIRLVKAVNAAVNKNFADLKHMNDFHSKEAESAGMTELIEKSGLTGRYINKATYNNYSTDAEGGYLLPPPTYNLDIERYETQYGVAFANCTVVTTDATVFRVNTGDEELVLTETGEGVAKTQTKEDIGAVNMFLRKFAGINIATDELVMDSAIDFWATQTERFGRARAKVADQIVFTEDLADAGGQTRKGLLFNTGVTTNYIADIADINWDTLDEAEDLVLAGDSGTHIMHRSLAGAIRRSKASTAGTYLAVPNSGQSVGGRPIVKSDLFPALTEVVDNYAIYGDLSKIKLFVNGGLALKVLSEGTVGSINLAEQDMTGLRAVTRMNKLVTFPERYIATTTAAS